MTTALEQGEYVIGRYRVRRASFTSLGWDSAGAWLDAVITNRRILLMGENEFENTVIPAQSIARIWNACLSGRSGVILAQKDRQLIYLVVEWSQGSRFERDVREMLVPVAQPRITPRPANTNLTN